MEKSGEGKMAGPFVIEAKTRPVKTRYCVVQQNQAAIWRISSFIHKMRAGESQNRILNEFYTIMWDFKRAKFATCRQIYPRYSSRRF